MSVEPLDSMGDFWTKWQGHIVNGTYRLGRYLGGSDHSGVFLTLVGEREPAQVALKLIPASTAERESRLADLRTAAGLSHPNLMRLLQTGRCELDGQSYLYVVMEFAEQTLAQILRNRPLTEEEAREMLAPTLNALTYLHGKKLVQGQLKPSNILAVGDRLKLATDTIRPISETGAGRSTMSAYDPPEYRDGGYSTAGDIWGLGMSLMEALSRRAPTGLDDGRGVIALPPDFSPEFRPIVAQCLSRRPYDRPKLTEIDAWFRRQATGAAWAGTPAAVPEEITFELEPRAAATAVEAAREPAASDPMIAEPLGAQAARGSAPRGETPRRLLTGALILGAIAIIALGLNGIRACTSHRTTAPPAAQAVGEAPSQPANPSGSQVTERAPTQQAVAAASPAAIHQELPDIPSHARQTIRGHIRISVRVIVDSEGKIAAARVDQAGPSRYFERLALEAARKWTFPPAAGESRRVESIRFELTRQGTKAHAVLLQ